jgi:uncharacterized membrane protein
MSDKDTLIVVAASYDNVQDAHNDYDAIKDLYQAAGVGHDFDASVVQRDADGKSHVISKHEESTRHGLKWGLAVGAACALFPAVGLIGGLVVGGGIGAAMGHVKAGMSDKDLKQLADLLEKGQAGLIVVYATNMADQVNALIKAEDTYVSQAMDIDRAALDKEISADAAS